MATTDSFGIKFLHGLKNKIQSGIDSGKIDRDDLIIAADTDDELIFINHNKEIKPIKSRTSKEFTLNGTSIGGLSDGDVIPSGTSIDDFFEMVTKKVIHPTYKNPEFYFTSTIEGDVEVGSSISPQFTTRFEQNDAGEVSSVKISYNGEQILFSVEDIINRKYPLVVEEGENVLEAAARFNGGSVKINNLGEADNTGIVKSGTIFENITINGKYKCFTGCLSSNDVTIEDLENYSYIDEDGTNITVNIPVGTKTIAFAYPASLQDVSNVTYVEVNDKNMAGLFNKEIVEYTLPNGIKKNYKLYSFTMDVPSAARMTFDITI